MDIGDTFAGAVLGRAHVPSLARLLGADVGWRGCWMVQGGASNMAGWQDRLLVSDRAHVVLDIHQTIDGLLEEEKGGKKVGTTKRGIGR
jgi:hypothetical protein